MTVTLSSETAAITLCAEGAMRHDAGDTPGAIACYQRAVALAPAVLSLHLILANAQQLAGQSLEARDTLRRAIRESERPDAAAEFTLGKALVDAGAGADAVPCFRRVRAEFPGDATAAAALAAALRDAQRPDDAWAEIQSALRMTPNDPVALLTAALIRHDLADYAGALQWCERSLEQRPDADGARVTRGYLRQLLGDADGGWHDFESRALPRPHSSAQRWHGDSLAGKSLLVIGEQGVGDQFQFLRFVHHPSLREAARVVVSCQPDAVSLLRAAGYDAVSRDVRIDTDLFVPLLSLPHLLGLGADWSGTAFPYLALPEPPQRTSSSRRSRIGIVWAGNPAHRNDAMRSIPSGLFHGLVQSQPAHAFVCLQHGTPAESVPPGIAERVVSANWHATAQQLLTLDLLITVDTGIAHLAGALGVHVWLLLPHVPDWRWGAQGNTTPWYPSMRLFRQPARGDWNRVLTNVSAALSTATLSD
jgi:Flp pilus assembly protein TadD